MAEYIEYRNSKGKFHREDGPAIEWPDGRKEWIINGQFHREDGPAIEWGNGWCSWFIRGKSMENQKIFQSKAGVSDEEMSMLILKYGEIT